MHLLLLALVIVARLALGVSSSHAAVPAGFQETVVASVSQPSVIGFAPDGRLFIGEKASGRIRIYKNGALLAQPFVDVNAFVPAGTYFDTFNERGLLGMAFDPSFATNGFLYVYYSVCKSPANPPQPGTNTCGSAKNRVVRFTAASDVVDATSPVVLLDDIDNDGGNHNAGWVGFGPLDGKLYVAIGDGGSFSAKAQDMGSLNGKILRLNADGTIPADNPFVTQAGARGEIWALGVRNPFRCRFATDGRLFCGDVGANGWEEVDLITKGANYGWPTTEGPFNATSFPQFTAPIHAYAHSTSVAIIGGDFGAKTSFPGDYQQSYFFGDFAIGRIQRALLSPSGTTVQSIQDFATSLGGNSVTDLIAGPDGSLYYTAYGANQVWRITATSTNRSPVAVASADVTSGPPPLLVHFSATGSSDPDGDPITYSWSFGDGSATSALASPSHQFAVKGTYTVTLTVSDGKATPGPGTATLVIAVGAPPTASIAAPLDGASFRAGDTIPLQGSASDSEDGVLPASSLHWRVIFHHADHYHPYIDDLPGSASSFTTATSGEPDSDVAYEIFLTATDSSGLSNTTSVVIVPVTSDFTLQTSPAGLGVTLDGQPKTAPVTTTGVVGLRRVIGAPPVQTVGAATYYFAGWSDGGLPTHEIVTPELDATFSASFMPPATCGAPVVLPAQGGTFTTATSGGSNQGGTCSTSTNSPEQVFQWTPAASGTATIATCGGATSFDTVLYVRSGTCDTGTQVACADDATGCGTTEPNDHHASRASLSVTAGQRYFIVVDGFDGANGTFMLTVTPPSGVAPTATRTATPVRTATPTTTAVATASATHTATPLATPSATVTPLPPTATRTSTPVPTVTSQPVATASPGPCNPIPVPPEGGTFTGTTSGTSAFAGTCAVTGASPDRVYQWTPAMSGTAIVATCGATSFDTALYVRSGSCQGTQVACNDDTAGCGTSEPNDHHASRATLAVTAGQTYFIVVDGYNGASGNYTLTITPPGGPTTTRTTTPTATVTPTLAATSTATTTVVPTKTATTTPARTATATTTPMPTATATTTVVPTTTATTTPVPTKTAATTPAPTATATIVPTATRTATPVPSGTSTPLPSPTRTTTRTPTPIATVTPPLDACSSVTLVPAEGGIFNASTAGSSTQAGSCGVTDKSGERIFQWTPAVSGAATIGTCGTATRFDTVLYLRSATCGGAETICVDDAAGCATGEPNDHHGSRIGPVVTAGQTYFIVVDGYNGASGAFSLTIVPPTAPTTTASATATAAATPTVTRTLTPVPTVTNVPTASATTTVIPVATNTPTRTATVIATATPTTVRATATPVVTATPIETATPTTTPQPTTTPLATSTPQATASASPTPLATAAPDPCGATVVPPEGGTFTGLTSGASGQRGTCGLSDKGPEAVFRWTPTASGPATISTCGSATLFDTALYVRTGSCGGPELGCNDDTVGCNTGEPNGYHGSRLSPTVTAGQTYYIVVDGYNGARGSFSLNVIPPP